MQSGRTAIFCCSVLFTALTAGGFAKGENRSLYHVRSPTLACSDPTYVHQVLDRRSPYSADPDWFTRALATGHCVTITSRSPWKLVYRSNDLSFMAYAGDIGTPGSYYFLTNVLFDDAGNHPGSASAKSPPPQLLVPPPKPQVISPTVRATQAAPNYTASRQSETISAPEPQKTVESAPVLSGSSTGRSVWAIVGTITAIFLFAFFRAKPAPSGTARPSHPAAPAVPQRTFVQPRSAKKPSMVWHPPGTILSVAGVNIPGGMIYVGQSTPYATNGMGCAIDPTLKVAPASLDYNFDTPGYWPSYAGISPSCRTTYLRWLASGKSDPAIDIGYVFLYFYGLERRLLVDRPPSGEQTLLVAEVERLRSIYSENGSFDGYSERLLEAVKTSQLLTDPEASSRFRPDPALIAGRASLPLKIAIARKVLAAEPLDFEFAVAGALSLPYEKAPWNRVVVDLSRSVFLDTLRPHFAEAFPSGFLLKNRRDSHLELSYQGASAGLQVELGSTASLKGLPDPATLNWAKLIDIAVQVSGELEPYAKMVAYHPERANSLAALTVCPEALARSLAIDGRSWIESLEKPIASVAFADLARPAIGSVGAKWTIRHHRQIADALSKVGRGMEPDPSDGSEHLEDTTTVYVFADEAPQLAKSPRFELATAGAILVAGVTRADPAKAPAIETAWLENVRHRLTLGSSEVVRLRARLRWLSTSSVSLSKVKRIVAEASPEDRETVAWSVAAAASAGGLVDKSDVAVLEGIYDKLKVPRGSLYSAIHGGAANAAVPAPEPITVAVGVSAPVYHISSLPKPVGMGLDAERLRQVRQDTERVSSVLADIFVEDEPARQETTTPETGENVPFAGLGAEYVPLAEKLIGKPTWLRADFEVAAVEAGIMPNGALEAINEWAFDRFDEPLIEDGETLVVNASLLTSMADRANAA